VTGRDIPDPTVTVDDTGVTQRLPGGAVNSVAWDDLVEVSVVTTDLGPFVEDVFFDLLGRDGSRCVVPQSSPAAEGLTERLFRLPGFDFAAHRQAMSSTTNATFLCWQRGRSDEPQATPGPAAATPVPGGGGGSRFWRSFLVWALIVGAVWVALNLAKGYRKGLLGGFPWAFYGGAVGFDGWALVGDIAVGVLVTVGVAAACAWSRTRGRSGSPLGPSRRSGEC
jgi:hypothetical protein